MIREYLEVIVEGSDAESGVAQVKSALTELQANAEFAVRTRDELDPETRKVVDPVGVAALVLSIPSAVVALMDVADRIKKRQRSRAVLERLRAVQTGTPSLRLHIVLADGPQDVDAIDEDTLLAAAEGVGGR